MGYISILLTERRPKTNVWTVFSTRTGNPLGHIKWFGRWRQYTFMPEFDTVFSSGCLNDIQDFIDNEMALRRANAART